MTHEEKVERWLRPFSPAYGKGQDFGVEIGAFKSPVPGIRPIYVDRFKMYAGEPCLADYWGDGTDLPFLANSLDYVVASHVLEHMANPIAAIWEWARVARHGGILYLVVPDRRYTFDHTRELTPPEHMLEDYRRGTTYSDGTHISDYLDHLDWSRWNPTGSAEKNAATREELRAAYVAAAGAGQEINIHFHVFEPANLDALVALMNRQPDRPCELVPVDRAERFPDGRSDGMLLVLRVEKPWSARLAGWLTRRRRGASPRCVLLPTAKRLDGSAEAPDS